MAAPLRRVLVCAPGDTGWHSSSSWRELGYFHEPRGSAADVEHARLVEALETAGAEVHFLPRADGLTLDAVYAHDASFPTDHGMVLMHPGKTSRRNEPARHERFYESLSIPILGRIEPPGVMEAGDMVWLDQSSILIGEGYRTNAEGIEQVRRMVAPFGVEVLAAPLPYGPGPEACLHLMSLISILDESAVLVDLPGLSVSTVKELERRGLALVPIDASERDGLACNVLALGRKKLLALEGNETTNGRLVKEGFEVVTFPGGEICHNGSGGPTCLTRPFLRG